MSLTLELDSWKRSRNWIPTLHN